VKDSTYRFMTRLGNLLLWGGQLVGEENLPKQGPAVLVVNHLDSLAPIATFCSVPLRLYIWIEAKMVDRQKAVNYLQWDLFEHELHLKPPLSHWLSMVLCKITVPLLGSFDFIPVYNKSFGSFQTTLDLTLDALREGKCVAIFPEERRAPSVPDPETKMYPFRRSFVRVGENYFKATGERLQFYPVSVHPTGFVKVGKPVTYNPFVANTLELDRIKDIMEQEIQAMYLKMERAKISGKRSFFKKRVIWTE
jgi:hypothetical protein